jgi:glycogen operon protein
MNTDNKETQNLPAHFGKKITTSTGKPYPLGVSSNAYGFNFAIFSLSALEISIIFFSGNGKKKIAELPLDPITNKTGNVWHILVTGIETSLLYGYQLKNDSQFSDVILLDPYATETFGGEIWGEPLLTTGKAKKSTLRLGKVPQQTQFNWGHQRSLKTALQDSIIYELHVRSFTKHSSSKVKNPGTFNGLKEKIPYLKNLGITAVELMPVTDFDETHPGNKHPQSGKILLNHWGYDPISFFAPKASYAANHFQPSLEFKELVKAFHKAGIEVILDMVFNHTGEGNEKGPIYHFKGLGAEVYYMRDHNSHRFSNYSGCGNTLNCNHPVVRNLILDSLRYWVTEMHIDGFRFDLASILGRGRDGHPLTNPPLIESIVEDPILANCKLIAEAWDAAGLYQVGTFPGYGRWLEWNGKFRDDIRRFVKGDPGMTGKLATRLAGSSDLYQNDGREPYHSVNFITCHDGFTLNDLVSYQRKRNILNGENNQDGSDDNISWNCGIEGPAHIKEIDYLRRKQIKNFISILLVSQGAPMISAGDEFLNTQNGNNNAYCQDNEMSWLNWNQLSENADIHNWMKQMIRFRKEHSNLRRKSFNVKTHNGIPEMSWHGTQPFKPDWSEKSRFLALFYAATPNDPWHIYLAFNNDDKSYRATPPFLPANAPHWIRFADSALEPPNDINDGAQPFILPNLKKYTVKPKSIVILIKKGSKIENLDLPKE